MQIVQVLRSAQRGGQETYVYELIKHLLVCGHSVTLVSLVNLEVDKRFAGLNIKIVRLNDSMGLSLRCLRTIYPLYKLFRELKPDVIHLHGIRPALVGAVSGRLALSKQVITTLHGSYKLMAMRPDGTLSSKRLAVGRLICIMGCCLATKIVTVSDSLREEVLEAVKGLPMLYCLISRKIRTVYFGIDINRYYHSDDTSTFRTSVGITSDEIIVGVITRLDEPAKGNSVLLKAAAKLKEKFRFQLFIAGDGRSRKMLDDLTREVDLEDRVKFMGWCQDIPDFLSNLDMFVLPSLSEGLGVVNLEAMAAALPIISTNVGGIPEVVINGVSGIIVHPGDVAELAEALETLFSNLEKRRAMGIAGRRIVEKRFKKEKFLQETIALYDCRPSLRST